MRVLDLSWNNIRGDVTNLWYIFLLSDFLTDNNTLIHLDLSDNKFSFDECN
jgi:hypothetical protein